MSVQISHLLRPSVRKDYVLVGRSGRYSSIKAGSSARPMDKAHACMYECSKPFDISRGLHLFGGPKPRLRANQRRNVFTRPRKEQILGKIFKKRRLLICKLGAGLCHLSEEASCYNPQPWYKQQFVHSYTDWEGKQSWIASARKAKSSTNREQWKFISRPNIKFKLEWITLTPPLLLM